MCVLYATVETRLLYIVSELVSSAKKSLARMLLIIVSLGYGTVKYVILIVFVLCMHYFFLSMFQTNVRR